MFNLRRLAAAAAVLTVAGPVLIACGDDGRGGASGPDGAIEVAQYNVKATGHVAKLRRDLGLD